VNVFNAPIIISGHGNMLGNCQSMVLTKFAEVLVNEGTIPFCLKLYLIA
jgi:hypothetical protein